ncbi:MAG: hypothetical protein MJZ66_10525 [Bacteroidales bacterium]|nr:hypothetical protein [Bacteroidales bacterium]
MRAIITLLFLMLAAGSLYAQTNLLGRSYKHVTNKLNEDPEFGVLKTDTIPGGTILLTCKGINQYPYYIFEFSQYLDECVSCSIITNNRQVYGAYLDFLSTVGNLVSMDMENAVREYEVRTMDGEILVYKIKQPFRNSELISKRSVVSIEAHVKID